MTVSTTSAPASSPTAATAVAASPASPTTKAARKSATKPAKKDAVKSVTSSKKSPSGATAPASRAASSSSTPTGNKDGKAKKPKLVRDSFTIPKDEYAAIETLKQRCAALAQPVKKSELLRAGLKVLTGMSDAALRKAVQAVPSIKTGRPKAEQAQAAPAPAPTPKKAASR
ncbi:MAG: hypothetical protein MRY84_11530 [Acidovorax sp.]|jgi:hypothetical protein|nr:hypothetical protein [Acidovorax sp.]MCI5069038.1 hypothetical protein [Acidovorax sp.]